MRTTHNLSLVERVALVQAHKLLTAITVGHDVWCECDLCSARMLTDTQDHESFTVTDVTYPRENEECERHLKAGTAIL